MRHCDGCKCTHTPWRHGKLCDVVVRQWQLCHPFCYTIGPLWRLQGLRRHFMHWTTTRALCSNEASQATACMSAVHRSPQQANEAHMTCACHDVVQCDYVPAVFQWRSLQQLACLLTDFCRRHARQSDECSPLRALYASILLPQQQLLLCEKSCSNRAIQINSNKVPLLWYQHGRASRLPTMQLPSTSEQQ